MTTAHDLIVDQFAPIVESGTRLTTWYAQGHTDGLGDRLLMFDNTSAPSWEILRFKLVLARDPRFEIALRHRIERLSSFHHPSFPTVRSIKALGQEHGLAVVSTYVTGVRLSDALRKPRSAEFALQLIRQLMPALNALHEHAPDVAHGILTLDRVVLTADGRLMIREHMLGTAIEGLDMPAEDLWAAFGILAPQFTASAGSPKLDSRSDVTQLALIALSLVAGRRIGPQDYPGVVRDLVGNVRLDTLRHWLARALRVSDHPFTSAREAYDALAQTHSGSKRDDDGLDATLRPPAEPRATRPDPAPAPPPPEAERQHPLAPTGIVAVPATRRPGRALRWAAAAAGVIAVVEAVLLVRVLFLNKATPPEADGVTTIASPPPPAEAPVTQSLSLAPLEMKIEPDAPPMQVITAVAAPEAGAKLLEVGSPADTSQLPASPSSRSGGFRVTSPIELHVLDGERVLGSSSDGPIVTRAGRYQLDFVNSVIGYRTRREVEVRAGQVISLPVNIPNGTLNINATPWAAVWIDGTSHGETPLGNVSIVPGEHEILFRHPQLGERRERVIVRPDTAGRVAVNMQR
jgi:hypothetical protein